ncbi:MAG TPA: right-handed parallel beta-helix repeat-containing protein [Pirellulales bacterium]|nr:right-handed parallel beta-helix repeat-containing protein [Pirellulales bacterium]
MRAAFKFAFASSWLVALVLAAVACGRLPACVASDIYVDNVGGDDLLDGTAPTKPGDRIGPVRTIAKAVRISGAGDRIILQPNPEPYRENFTLFGANHSGLNSDHPFVLEANGAILDGSAPAPGLLWEHYQGEVFRFAPPRLAYQQLFLDGRPAVRRFFDNANGKFPNLQPKEWFLSDTYIYFRAEKDKLPGDYRLSYAAQQTGVTLYRVHDVAIFDLTVQGFQQDGICAHDGVRQTLLANVNCRGNGRAGIAVMNASQLDIADSLVGDNGFAQILFEGYSETHLTQCQILNNTAPPFVRRGGRLFIDGKPFEREPSPAKQP